MPEHRRFQATEASRIRLDPDARLSLATGAVFTLTERRRIRFERGAIAIDTASRVTVRTPEVLIVCVAGLFTVRRTSSGTEVSVDRGEVRLTADTGGEIVPEGGRRHLAVQSDPAADARGVPKSQRTKAPTLERKPRRSYAPTRKPRRPAVHSKVDEPISTRRSRRPAVHSKVDEPISARRSRRLAVHPKADEPSGTADRPAEAIRVPRAERAAEAAPLRAERRPTVPKGSRPAPATAPTKALARFTDAATWMRAADAHRRAGRRAAAVDLYAKVAMSGAAPVLKEEAMLRRAELLTELGSPDAALAVLRASKALGSDLLFPERRRARSESSIERRAGRCCGAGARAARGSARRGSASG